MNKGIAVQQELRSSHFVLGNNNNFNRFSTSYKSTIANPNQQSPQRPENMGLKLNLREAHFSIGNENPQNYLSTHNRVYIKHPLNDGAQLNEE